MLKGSERLRRRHTEIADARSRAAASAVPENASAASTGNFHKALMQLRQEWRLKTHQSAILGDVSLRSIGSRFRESGNFEVRESDDTAQGGEVKRVDSSGGIEVRHNSELKVPTSIFNWRIIYIFCISECLP